MRLKMNTFCRCLAHCRPQPQEFPNYAFIENINLTSHIHAPPTRGLQICQFVRGSQKPDIFLCDYILFCLISSSIPLQSIKAISDTSIFSWVLGSSFGCLNHFFSRIRDIPVASFILEHHMKLSIHTDYRRKSSFLLTLSPIFPLSLPFFEKTLMLSSCLSLVHW